MHLAIVQNDSKYRKSLDDNLGAAGHRVQGFTTTSALKSVDAGEMFDLVLVEWEQLGNGAQPLFDWIRGRFGASVTIIALSAWPKDADIIAALQAGADDHLSKSVAPAVLRARVDAIGRRSQPGERGNGGNERFGDYLFDIPASQVSYRTESIIVTAKEFTLALTLFRNLGRPLSRAALLESLWGRDPDRPTRTLDSHMSKLRAKLGLRPERGFRLTPIYGFGYRLDPGGAPAADAAPRDETETR